MGTKTISIMDDVYDMLKAIKRPEESFSDEIRRLAVSKNNILEFAGAWKDLSKDEINTIKDAINNMRSGSRIDEIAKKIKRDKNVS